MPNYKYIHEVEPAIPAQGDKPSRSAVYRHIVSKDGFKKLDDVTTLFELFETAAKKYANSPCLGFRPKDDQGNVGPFVFKTYSEVHQEVGKIASGLKALGVEAQQRVGILGSNCPEWMMAMQACNRLSLHAVPLYDSLGENAIEYIINHSESVVAFVAANKLAALIKALPKTKATLKHVVCWGAADSASLEAVKAEGYTVHSLSELEALGEQNPAFPVPPKPEDLCTIMYTSGTTGDPKGVLLTHQAVLTAVCSSIEYCKFNKIDLGHGDRLLSYLPLAHIFDRVCEEWFLYIGGCIGYWQGDVTKLLDDVGALKPSMFIGVPRVYDRIYSRVMGMVQGGSFLKKLLFNWGMRRKLHYMKLGYSQKHAAPFFDKLVFSKVAARLGGKVKAVVSGGAPLAPHVEDFLRVTMCAPVVQGYGLTETSASSFIACADTLSQSATVGPPTPCTEFRLESVPEMNYDALDATRPAGEVLIRSPQNFSGYYKAQDKTDEVLESDGWFHSGDIAVLTPDGAIKIVDRKKNIFKLSQGEYVAVEKVEASFKKNLNIEQIWVYGNSFKSSLVAVVVPAQDQLMAWAKENGIEGDFKSVCANPKAKEYLLAELTATGKAERLKGFEMVKAIHVDSAMFSVEEDLLTPTFKLKRPQLQKKYQPQIDAMYTAIKE